jgi:PKHD-type hydroxylase
MKLFNDEDLKKINEVLAPLSWEDGRNTAYGSTKLKKRNQQITELDPLASPILASIKNHIYTNRTIKYAAFPRNIHNLRFAKYGPGDSYGWHIDQAIMDQYRSDISFTIFLNEDYEGGELEFEIHQKKFLIKAKPGEMVLYPTGTLHQVRSVTKGERLVIVGWIESLIPVTEDRDNLFGLVEAVAKLKSKIGDSESFERIDQSIHHVIRMASR